MSEIAVREPHYDADIAMLEVDPPRDHFAWLSVLVYRLKEGPTSSGSIAESSLIMEGTGEIAREPGLLPPSSGDQFELGLRLLRNYAQREGSTEVPLDHREDGVTLGAWVDNMRFEEANHGLRPDWKRKLETVPGWRWLPGDDFYLLERYARREGHTRMPVDHLESGRPLGGWVRDLRETHAAGRLSPEWVEKLESIPGWEW